MKKTPFMENNKLYALKMNAVTIQTR